MGDKKIIVLVFAALFINTVSASDDPLAAKGSAEDALTSPLRTVSLVTDDIDASRAFYEKGMGLTCSKSSLSEQQTELWNLANGVWSAHLCTRPATDGGVQVRILFSEAAQGEIRSDFDARRTGILSMGFAIKNIKGHQEAMKGLGYPTNSGVTTITLPTTSGGTYVVKETHYRGPHNSYNLGIERPDGFDPVGEIEAATGVGGPAYSGIIVDKPDAFKAFMEQVMGYEARRDIEFESSGPNGGLGLAKGTKMRFIQMYSPGSTTDYVIVMSMGDAGLPSTSIPKPPSKGLAMWSFSTKKYDEVLARVKSEKFKSLTHTKVEGLRMMTFEAPSGIFIEVVEQVVVQ